MSDRYIYTHAIVSGMLSSAAVVSASGLSGLFVLLLCAGHFLLDGRLLEDEVKS